MPKGMLPEKVKVKKQILNQEDFIEFVLKRTNELSADFRIYETPRYIWVAIDKVGITEGMELEE